MPKIKSNKLNNDNNSDDVSRNDVLCCACSVMSNFFVAPWPMVYQAPLSMEWTVEIVHNLSRITYLGPTESI